MVEGVEDAFHFPTEDLQCHESLPVGDAESDAAVVDADDAGVDVEGCVAEEEDDGGFGDGRGFQGVGVAAAGLHGFVEGEPFGGFGGLFGVVDGVRGDAGDLVGSDISVGVLLAEEQFRVECCGDDGGDGREGGVGAVEASGDGVEGFAGVGVSGSGGAKGRFFGVGEWKEPCVDDLDKKLDLLIFDLRQDLCAERVFATEGLDSVCSDGFLPGEVRCIDSEQIRITTSEYRFCSSGRVLIILVRRYQEGGFGRKYGHNADGSVEGPQDYAQDCKLAKTDIER